MNILGISAFYHDSAAVFLSEGNIVAAAQEERFSRIKHDSSFPVQAVHFCLDYAGLNIDELDAIAFYDKPLLKFERLLETYYAFAPKGLPSFIKAMPVWLNEKMFLKRRIHQELATIQAYDKKKLTLLFPEHHLSHAASTFYASSFSEAAILTIDGVGEWATATICKGKGKDITILKELHFPHSLGLLYSAFTYYLGFKVNSGEYKMMGLAPYGIEHAEETQYFLAQIKKHLIHIHEDGSLWLDQSYFQYATGLRMLKDRAWEELLGLKRRIPESRIEQSHCNLALAIQKVTEEVVYALAQEAKKLTQLPYLCMAGGVALNSVSNGKLAQTDLYKEIFIQPAAGDAGGALGAAYAAHHIYFEQERLIGNGQDQMQGAYLGPQFSYLDIELTIKKFKGVYHYIEEEEQLCEELAHIIASGNVVGWFQGRMEFGPRALGARSILGDARNPEMQKKLNLKIKYRESFRPFAPSVLDEEAASLFDIPTDSPYMLYVFPIASYIRKDVPENYDSLDLQMKLYTERSQLPAITHVDFSARIQTVHKETNPRYWTLLKAFKEITGYAVLINTSFNVRGEPIVCTPDDAYQCFMRTEMDYLVMGNYLFKKEEQPHWNEKKNWKEEFVLD